MIEEGEDGTRGLEAFGEDIVLLLGLLMVQLK
jgi:hypothetical protein